jgi:hypothetical protein
MRRTIIPILFVLLIGSSILVSIPNSSGQEDTKIPGWIKDVAGWWANSSISEREFMSGIEYLINNNIISIQPVPCSTANVSSTELVPDWIKNNAMWWSEDLIEDADFINGIQYLVKKQIISIDNKKIVGEIPLEDVIFSTEWKISSEYLVFIQSSFFEIYGSYGECVIENGNQVWKTLLLGLHPTKGAMYNEVAVWNDPQNAAVVYPYFTAVAYTEPGFYTYYRGECDSCTTTKFSQQIPLYSASAMGHQSLSLLGYQSITDVEIDKNPGILAQFDKVIMLHNEYVTRTMFDAITNHPNVIYLYPNALYAEIEVDYVDNTITLIRGHGYPDPKISNGFDWEFDNTHPYEYDNTCLDMQFYKIKNGWMTNCYPENIFLENTQKLFNLLKAVKDL